MQLIAAQDFTCNPFVVNRLRTNSRYPHENKEFWGEGGGGYPNHHERLRESTGVRLAERLVASTAAGR